MHQAGIAKIWKENTFILSLLLKTNILYMYWSIFNTSQCSSIWPYLVVPYPWFFKIKFMRLHDYLQWICPSNQLKEALWFILEFTTSMTSLTRRKYFYKTTIDSYCNLFSEMPFPYSINCNIKMFNKERRDKGFKSEGSIFSEHLE